MEAFYRPAVSPFQLPPLSTTIYPLFQRPGQKKFVLEKLAHIIKTIVVESLTLSLKIIIIESTPPPPLFRRQKNLVTLATKLATFFSFNSTTFHHHNNATLKKNRNLQILLLFGTKIYQKKTHTPTTLLSFN